jgi:hypothetical protein
MADRNLLTFAILPPAIGRTGVAQVTSSRTWLSGTVSVGSRKLKLRRAAAQLPMAFESRCSARLASSERNSPAMKKAFRKKSGSDLA